MELDRFVDALIAIRGEIREIETGEADRDNNLLKNAPHPLADLLSDSWDRPYARDRAAPDGGDRGTIRRGRQSAESMRPR